MREGELMIYDLPLWNWLLFFFVYIPIVILWIFAVIDVFSRHDLSGWAKVGWLAFALFLPLIGASVYLIIRVPEVVEKDQANEKRAA